MNIIRIAWRNIGRNKRRSILTAMAMTFAVVVLVFIMALQRGSYAEMIHNTVHAHAGHLQIQRKGYWPDMDLAKKLMDSDRIMDAIRHVPHLEAVAPRVNAPALVSKGQRTFGTMIFGIDPDREAGVSTLKNVVRRGEYLARDDLDGVLIGEMLAKNLAVDVGDDIIFIGQGADGSIAAGRLQVRGIVHFGIGEMDRTTMAAHIDTVREAYSMVGAVSEIAVIIDHDKHREEAQQEIVSRLADGGFDQAVVLGWPELLPGVEQSIQLDWSSGLILYGILALVVGFGIANTFLMAFMERIHEFGVLLSLGIRPLQLALMVYAESVLLTLLGVAGGLVVGIPLVLYFQVRGINFGVGDDIMSQYGLTPIIHPLLSTLVLKWGVGIVVGFSLVFAVYPARKAASLNPVEALRHS